MISSDQGTATATARSKGRFSASSGSDSSSSIGTARSSTSSACASATPATVHFSPPLHAMPALPPITAPATSADCASSRALKPEENRW